MATRDIQALEAYAARLLALVEALVDLIEALDERVTDLE